MHEIGFRAMVEMIKTSITQIRTVRERAAAVTGFLEGMEKRNPGQMYRTDQVILLIKLIWPEKK